jgi:hypothetical protein
VNNQNLILSNLVKKKNEIKKVNNCTMPEINGRNKNKKAISSRNHISTRNNSDINSFLNNNFISSTMNNNDENTNSNDLTTVKKNNNNNSNLIYTPNVKKKYEEKINDDINKKKIFSTKSINNKNTKYFYNEVNINKIIGKKKNKNHDNISNEKINRNSNKQHLKLNSTPFSTSNMYNNANSYTNYYYANSNSIINANETKDKDKNSQIQSKNYKYKRINNIKNNVKDIKINKIDKLLLFNNKNNNFYPLALTDRNKQDKQFSSINSYPVNIPNKNKK